MAMNDFVVSVPQVMDDSIFVSYGGETGTSTAAQRIAAYAIAETQAQIEIGTFLVETIYTGTFTWPYDGTRIQLPHSHLKQVYSVASIHEIGCDCSSVELSGCAWVLHHRHALVDVRECGGVVSQGGCNCGCSEDMPAASGNGVPVKQFRIVYQAGHDQVAGSPNALMALTVASKKALEQIIDPSGALGGPGDQGITNFSDSGYSQSFAKVKMTGFGNSPEAMYAAQLMKPFKTTRPLRMR